MRYAALVSFIAIALLSGMFASQFEPGVWYALMNKPAWTPPDWVFAPVWIALYVLMGAAAWLVWQVRGWHGSHWLFVAQLVLNAGWSWLFFGLHRTGWALGEMGVLWLLVLAMMVGFWRVRAAAGVLILPYWLWLCFTLALNYELWRLNEGGLHTLF